MNTKTKAMLERVIKLAEDLENVACDALNPNNEDDLEDNIDCLLSTNEEIEECLSANWH